MEGGGAIGDRASMIGLDDVRELLLEGGDLMARG